MALYATPTELRTALGVNGTVLPDDRATVLLEDACDWVDQELGLREIDESTGRKVIEGEVEAWQFAKLKRATVKAAAKLYARPSMLSDQRFDRVKGPDFETQGPRTSNADLFGSDVAGLLDQSGLRVLTTVFGTGRNRPPWYGFSFNDPDEL